MLLAKNIKLGKINQKKWAEIFYNEFVNICKDKTANKTQTGIFGSDMKVESINDGPVTLFVRSRN